MSEIRPVLYETHMHTVLCNHAQGPLEAYAGQAFRRGLKGMIVTCHCPLPDRMSARARMRPEEWDTYVRMVRECQDRWSGRLDVRLGVESDYLPGLEDWLTQLHGRDPLSYVLGSVHPQISEYQDLYFNGDWPAFHRQYFESLAEAAETGLFDSLSHPDLVKNYGSAEWNYGDLHGHICFCLDRIAATGVSMELNTSGLQKTVPEMNPSLPILKEMCEREIPVVIGADAHQPERVAAQFEEALDLVKEAGYTRTRIFLDRRPVDLPVEESRTSLIRTS